jgi:hypothetical protein
MGTPALTAGWMPALFERELDPLSSRLYWAPNSLHPFNERRRLTGKRGGDPIRGGPMVTDGQPCEIEPRKAKQGGHDVSRDHVRGPRLPERRHGRRRQVGISPAFARMSRLRSLPCNLQEDCPSRPFPAICRYPVQPEAKGPRLSPSEDQATVGGTLIPLDATLRVGTEDRFDLDKSAKTRSPRTARTPLERR